MICFRHLPAGLVCLALTAALVTAKSMAAEPVSVSGIYPQLAMFNQHGECGTGAVVPWADRLWVITYGPHFPRGSTDKLYEITPALEQIIRPESIGGTPANRMIHRESRQLFIGPYVIDEQRQVRTIPLAEMTGRLTGNARHLLAPEKKIYFATMEEGLYEVDVTTLKVKELFPDSHTGRGPDLLPGYHGKGLYSAQGRLVYANNGENSPLARQKPNIPSGVLAQWQGEKWEVIRRNQFTEVTGPGGIEGNRNPDDPLWSVGWDHRSLILMLFDGGRWQTFRLPKGSHSYDGAHGWNTEWPRIREIGEGPLLMTMHGTFWEFPRTFRAGKTAGIRARSNYLKVVGDFCRWGDRLVLGCDDAAKSEFLNTRRVKGKVEGPGLSQSNLWFIQPEKLADLGPAMGHGALWLNEGVTGGEPSDPFLFSGYDRYAITLFNDDPTPLTVSLEVDRLGDGNWTAWKTLEIPPHDFVMDDGPVTGEQVWLRAATARDTKRTTLLIQLWNPDVRTSQPDAMCNGLAPAEVKSGSGGLLRARGNPARSLSFAASTFRDGKVICERYYEMDADLKLRRVENSEDHEWLKKHAAIPQGVLQADAASLLVVDDQGRRFRFPRGDAHFDLPAPLPLRVAREVCTERDLFQAGGTFYELPAENADGFMRIRPITTHNRRITDFCSWRGLLVLSGVAADAPADNPHIVRSDDGQAAVWLGAVDDLWKFGKPRGEGGPWKDTSVEKDQPSDPYLLNGFDYQTLTLSHDHSGPVDFTLEIDAYGNGEWHRFGKFSVNAASDLAVPMHRYRGWWLRLVSSVNCRATAWLK